MNQPFTRIDDDVLQGLVRQACRRIVFIAPGVRNPVAEALAEAMKRLPNDAMHLVFDVDAEVCRLGYADTDLAGLKLLQAAAAGHGLTISVVAPVAEPDLMHWSFRLSRYKLGGVPTGSSTHPSAAKPRSTFASTIHVCLTTRIAGKPRRRTDCQSKAT
jgi:hypothetical protein